MQCRLVVCYRCFGTNYRSIFKGQAVQEESRNVELTVRTAPFVVASSSFAIRIVNFEVGTTHSAVSTLSFLPGTGLFAIETTIWSLRILYVSVGTARSAVCKYVCMLWGGGGVLFAVSNVHIAFW
jgi:hypothetical protein